jgi:hypothetical protein
MAVVYVLLAIALIWYVGRPTGPSKPEPEPDTSKVWEEIINLTIAGTVLFWVLVIIFLCNR